MPKRRDRLRHEADSSGLVAKRNAAVAPSPIERADETVADALLETTDRGRLMESITLGDVTVTRITEWEGCAPITAQLAPEGGREVWERHSSWLAPRFWNRESNEVVTCSASYLVRSAGKNILIDTASGNGKERPYFPLSSHLDTPYIQDLGRAGVKPEDVDIVVCTHLHFDHVGWNTVLENREWVPTFPNASYLFTLEDFDYWNPLNDTKPLGALVNQNAYEDSIAPIHNAGQAVLWSGSHTIDENLSLVAAPGHTPGSAIVTLESGSDRAIFIGDVLNNPIQIVEPHWNSCFCEDPQQARRTRREVLSRAADTNALLLANHFAGGHAAEIRRTGDRFRIVRWIA
jgi:glyoxylase-like metal-dependent hydrolase (beta-lactamase superfamily II)